jgi:hypothetical protein
MPQDSEGDQPTDSQITIDRLDMGTGWVCFEAGEKPPPPGELPRYLNHMFYTWLQRHPEFTVRATLPVVENGNMVVLHVWFD